MSSNVDPQKTVERESKGHADARTQPFVRAFDLLAQLRIDEAINLKDDRPAQAREKLS